MKALKNKSKQDYGTPPWVVVAAQELITGKPFDLDAAARMDNAVCNAFIGPSDYQIDVFGDKILIGIDALHPLTHWNGETVWCNPPFATPGPWILKAREEVDTGYAGEVVMLLPASTATKWFHQLAAPLANNVYLIGPRINYIGGTSGSAFGSMFLHFKPWSLVADSKNDIIQTLNIGSYAPKRRKNTRSRAK